MVLISGVGRRPWLIYRVNFSRGVGGAHDVRIEKHAPPKQTGLQYRARLIAILELAALTATHTLLECIRAIVLFGVNGVVGPTEQPPQNTPPFVWSEHPHLPPSP